MKAIAAALFLSIASVAAKQPPIKPGDFQPLTSLPWKEPNATLESVLQAIFLEPNAGLRAAVLAQYLTLIPVERLGKALDLSIELEGSQTPNDLVKDFLFVWAKRDPEGCWRRTQELFHMAGIEDGWLGYDGWLQRSRITAQNLEAIRHSPFYLRSEAFAEFPLGINQSSIPKVERVRILREFADKWLGAFGVWPRPEAPRPLIEWGQIDRAFNCELASSLPEARGLVGNSPLAVEVGLRRWITKHPESAPEVIRKLDEESLDPSIQSRGGTGRPPYTELLMLWLKVDQAGILSWAEGLDQEDTAYWWIRAFLVSRVDEQTRQRWFAKAKSEKSGNLARLIEGWMEWDPQSAVRAVADHAEYAEAEGGLLNSAVYGPWDGYPKNTSLYGISVVASFPFEKLGRKVRYSLLSDCYSLMEQWGGLDAGEAARFGLRFLLELWPDYAQRDKLIGFFSGQDVYAGEDGMIDRTFCALRVWAVIGPDEMTAWIKTIKDPQMRKALTWLHDHPWGSGPEE